jgi:hypothetical protein
MRNLTELEGELAELRAAYEQYFMGNDRLPPLKKHDAFKKQYLRMKGSSVRQTAVKFRLESIGQKLLTFERLWERTLKDIENGTYKRDLARLKRHQHGGPKKKDADFDVDEDLDISDLGEAEDDLSSVIAAAEKAVDAVALAKPVSAPLPSIKPVTGTLPAVPPMTPSAGVKPVAAGLKPITNPFAQAAAPVSAPKITSGSFPAITPARTTTGALPAPPLGAAPKITSGSFAAVARPAAPVAPRAATAGDGGLSEQKIKAIYDAYVMAKKRTGEDTRSLTLDSVASSLKKQVPELMKQHNAKSVEFKVVIKDGKAILRALPKE